MSQLASHSSPPDGKGEDQIAFGKVIGVGVVSLIIFALSIAWAGAMLHRETARVQAATGASRTPAALGMPEIGIVDQVPFSGDQRLGVWRKAHAARLNGYGWTDRARGVAHVPIEQAMDAVAAGALPAGAPR